MRYQSLAHKFSSIPWLAEVLALVAGIWVIVQTWMQAHLQASNLDEGAYLVKGYLYATGQYTLYQPFGPWSNHMPLSFLVPGYVQAVFGPGLRTGRYYAVFLAGLMLIGLWILTNRLGGKWWAAAVMWVLAINPAIPKMYSLAVSQVLVACMLIWTLVFVVGEDRSIWQIVIGSVLAGLTFLTRVNMIPVLPLVALYVLWQHGLKAGVLSAAAGGIIVLIGHAVYWPGILQMWKQLPRSVTPFLDPWRVPESYEGIWQPDVTTGARILSFFQSFRAHFVVLIGILAAWVLWPQKSKWKSPAAFRDAVFISLLFLSLFFLHMWAALGRDYCVYCLAGYLSFFSSIGLLLIVITFSAWRRQIPLWYQIAICILIVGLSAGIGFATFEDIGETLYNIRIPRIFLVSASSGSVPLGAIFANKFGLDVQELRRLLPIIFGALAGILVLLTAFIIRTCLARRAGKPKRKIIPTFGYLALLSFFIVGAVLSPTVIFGGGYRGYECAWSVISTYESVGDHLAKTIPPGSLVYWQGGLSAVPLLYLPGIRIFPAQINDGYSYRTKGESDVLVLFGLWNNELANQWLGEADFILVEERTFLGRVSDAVESGEYIELETTPPQVLCRDDSRIKIFKRAP